MIPLGLQQLATIVGGEVAGDPSVTVTAPTVMDGRLARPGGLFAAFVGEQADGHDYVAQARQAGAVAVLGSRPTALPTVVVRDVESALQALARYVIAQLRRQLTVVAVTGSQGKTSTKDLTAAVLSRTAPTVSTFGNLNNELGVPLTMLWAEPSTRYLVLEMGASHVGDIAKLTSLVAPDISIVLNVGKAHLGEFGSQDAIATAKGELVRGLAARGTAVLNADDPRVAAMRALAEGPVVTFGYTNDSDVRVTDLSLDRLGRPAFTLQTASASAAVTLPLVGAHQALNAAAATAAALTLGIPLKAAAAALGTAVLSGQRLQLRNLADDALLIDDSYNASPGSMRSSLDALASIVATRRIAVLGEIRELGEASATEHRMVGAYAADRADIVLAVGETTLSLAEGAGDGARHLPDNAAAIEWLHAHLRPGDVVLVKGSRGAHVEEIADALY
jgi:UDP-N-acetylmuramoyl-tripeptide--D-alanyl-D-alanine ligase